MREQKSGRWRKDQNTKQEREMGMKIYGRRQIVYPHHVSIVDVDEINNQATYEYDSD